MKHMKSNHVGIRCNFIREYFSSKKILSGYLQSNENVEDVLTSPFCKESLEKFKNYLSGLQLIVLWFTRGC